MFGHAKSHFFDEMPKLILRSTVDDRTSKKSVCPLFRRGRLKQHVATNADFLYFRGLVTGTRFPVFLCFVGDGGLFF